MPPQSTCSVERDVARHDETAAVFIVTPHRSSDRGLWIFHVALCVALLLAQILTLANGLWPISVLFGLNALVLIGALHIRRVCREQRREEISITESEVVIRRFAFRSPMRELRLRTWGLSLTRCEDPDYGCLKLLLNSWRTQTEIGRDLSPAERSDLAAALTNALQTAGIAVAVDVRPPRSRIRGRERPDD